MCLFDTIVNVAIVTNTEDQHASANDTGFIHSWLMTRHNLTGAVKVKDVKSVLLQEKWFNSQKFLAKKDFASENNQRSVIAVAIKTVD